MHKGFLFASSDTTVYRWAYTVGTRSSLGNPAVVVRNINADGKGGAPMGHWTRTLAFDLADRLYISVGSLGNVDADSYRSRIRRFVGVTAPTVAGGAGFEFQTGEVFADGLRNEVGLAFNSSSSDQVLFGVENGAGVFLCLHANPKKRVLCIDIHHIHSLLMLIDDSQTACKGKIWAVTSTTTILPKSLTCSTAQAATTGVLVCVCACVCVLCMCVCACACACACVLVCV